MNEPADEHQELPRRRVALHMELTFTAAGYRWWCARADPVREGEHVAVIVSFRQLLEHADVMHHGDLLHLDIDARTQADLAWALDLRLLTPGRSRV